VSEFESWEAGVARRDRIDQLRAVLASFGSLFENEQKEFDALEAKGPTPQRDLGFSRWRSEEENEKEWAAMRAAWDKAQWKKMIGGTK
jgi:hypothetical protein